MRIDTHHHAVPSSYRELLQKPVLTKLVVVLCRNGVRTAHCRPCPNSAWGRRFCRCPRRAPRSCRIRPTLPRWLATSTTTWPLWSLLRRIGSDSSRPSPCRMSTSQSARLSGRSTNCTLTASSCWPTRPESTWARTVRTTCSRRWMHVRRWSSSIRPICRDPPSAVFCPSRRIFCSTQPARHTFWYATKFVVSIPTSNSS